MISIRFLERDGKVVDAAAEPGLTVLEVARQAGVHGMLGKCCGRVQCRTCHVLLDPRVYDLLPPPGEAESRLLAGATGFRPGVSRLGCQIQISESLRGAYFQVAQI